MRPAPLAASVALAALSAVLVVTGCSSPPAPAAAPGTAPTAPAPGTSATTKAPTPSTVYANDPRQPVAAHVGETIALRVDTDPAAEESWEVVRFDQAVLFDIGAGYDTTATTVLGRTVTQNLLFRATAVGRSEVVLRYGRPGTPSPSDTTVTFTVIVS